MSCTENVSSFLRTPRILPAVVGDDGDGLEAHGDDLAGRRISRSSAAAERAAPMRDRLGPRRPPLAVDHVALRRSCLCPSPRTTARPWPRRRARRPARPARSASAVGNDHPDFVFRHVGVARHLGAGDAAGDGLEDLRVGAAMDPVAGRRDRCRGIPSRRCRGRPRSARERCSCPRRRPADRRPADWSWRSSAAVHPRRSRLQERRGKRAERTGCRRVPSMPAYCAPPTDRGSATMRRGLALRARRSRSLLGLAASPLVGRPPCGGLFVHLHTEVTAGRP